jgi:hypothetical protein
MTQVVEHLPRKLKALNLGLKVPPPKKTKNITSDTQNFPMAQTSLSKIQSPYCGPWDLVPCHTSLTQSPTLSLT